MPNLDKTGPITGEGRGLGICTDEEKKKKGVKGPLDSIGMKYAGEVKSAKLERCVRKLVADPDFKPKKGRTKEQSAWAVCRESLGE